MKYLTVLVIIALLHCGWTEEDKENKTFVATKEWQEIPEGQGIPAGLHVRINLETGKKEAKILDDEDNEHSEEKEQEEDKKTVIKEEERTEKNKGAVALSIVHEEGSESDNEKTAADIGEKPKKIKHLDEALQRIGIDYKPKEKVGNVIREYRSYEEIKKTFETMRKSFKTDGEIIVQLIDEFRNNSSAADIKDVNLRIKNDIRVLESLNNLVSQYDNALIFVNHGGLEHVLLPILVNQTHTGLKVEAMKVLGAMSQNNPRVKVKVFEYNVAFHLAQIIMTSTKTDELSAALYAFSSVLRKFPLAQKKILSTSGTQALISVLSRECELKIKAKAATFIGDLLEERESVLNRSTLSHDSSAYEEYTAVNLKLWLSDHDYCDVMSELIYTHSPAFLEAPDILEYFINALHHSCVLCSTVWQENSILMGIFTSLQQHFNQSLDEYHQDVANLLMEFLKHLYGDKFTKHDEL